MFSKNHIHFDNLDSTNEFTLSLKGTPMFREGLLISTKHQTKGKGQRGKKWESGANKNLLISVVIEPNIPISKQFTISKLVALAIYDLLISLGLKAKIKWPNDILVNSKKIAGILIQNRLKKNQIIHSVIGIGVNVNQTKFSQFDRKATSLKLVLNKAYDILEVQHKLLHFLEKRVIEFKANIKQDKDYLQALYLFEKWTTFEVNNTQFSGRIKGVNRVGKLIIEKEDRHVFEYDLQEIKLLF